MHFSRPARWSAMFASLTCLAACGLEEDPSITDAAGAADIFRFVTGHARAALNSEGLFETTLREELPGGPDEIPEIEAHRQALAWARVYGESARVYLEPQHGAPIDPDNLEVCNRTFYAASRFRPLPEVVPDPERRMFGPWWFVQLCVGEVPQVLIAVSAYNQGLVNTAGEFEYPRYAGNHFFPYGIPDARLEKLMILPEQAVRLASETAGVPISSLPELVMSHRGVFEAQWRFTLNEPTRLGSARGILNNVTELYVGGFEDDPGQPRAAAALVGAVGGRQTISFSYVMNVVEGEPLPRHLDLGVQQARVREGRAIEFERVTSDGQEALR